ncbi:unnamed protein product [Discula destructiva]
MADSGWGSNSEQVNTLAMITTNDTAEARSIFVKALNQHNGNTERVMDEYFSAASFEAFASKYTYDPTAWDADRDGEMPALVVQGPDEHGPTWEHINGNGLSAPSRPPSRNKSPLGTMTDWTLDNTLGGSAPANQSAEDEQLQRAIQLSMGTSTPQDSGIATTWDDFQQQSPVFGPATRDDHKVDEWAMVRASKTPDDPPPSGRKRQTGYPVFLRCRKDQAQMHGLGPLIMLLHKIPAARNFFLSLDGDEASGLYGSNAGWWRGECISARPSEGSQGAVSLLDELKRLMAFLDAGDRSYGTADSVLATKLMNGTWGDPTARFFESLYNFTDIPELRRMWTSITLDTDDEARDQEFAILNFTVQQDMPEQMRSLYSQWDHLFWIQPDGNSLSGPEDKPSTIAYIRKPANVITMRVATDGFSIEIPEILYIDRYLESNIEIARSMRDQMFFTRRSLGKYQSRVERLTQMRTKTGHTADLRHVLRRLIMRSEGLIRQVRATALWQKHEESIGTDRYFPYLPEQLVHLIDEVELSDAQKEEVTQLETEARALKLKLARIESAISNVNAERDECIANLQRLNRTLTVPSEDEALIPTHKYTLRGVVTSPTVLYMCRRKEPEPFAEVDDDANLDEWYLVRWDGDENQVRHEPITFAIIKENMFTEVDALGNTAPILVYATDEGLSEEPVPLSAALQTFVKHDNRLFKQELIEQPEQRGEKRLGFRTPQSPAKRQRSDSGDSMDSNRASPGDMSDGDRAQMMQDQMLENFGGGSDIGMDTEMRDMQPISEDQMANEIAAHMPPTPSLSADGSASPPIRRSTEQLANMSLADSEAVKAPEMEELSAQAPFIVRRPASAQDSRFDQPAEATMNWPDIDETTAISGGNNPEEFYHQSN